MRVLHVIPGVSAWGGAEASLVLDAALLPAHGVELHVALLTDRQEMAPQLREAGATLHDLSGHGGLPARVIAIRNLVGSLRPDVVHASLYEASVPTQLAIATLRKHPPLLVTWASTLYTEAHRSSLDVSPLRMARVRWIETVLGKLSDSRYQAVTRGVGEVNRRQMHVRADHVLVGERGRDRHRLDASPDEVMATRRDLAQRGIGDDAAIVLAAGREHKEKGYELLVEQFDLVADRVPDAWLVIAGNESTATADLTTAIAGMRHGDRVVRLGQRSDVPALLHLARVVVCSSLREGAAGSLIEAMACERPVVSVRVDGLDGVLVDDVNALVVEPPGLGAAIARVLEDPDLAARLARSGRDTFEGRFTVERSAGRLAEIYERLNRGTAG